MSTSARKPFARKPALVESARPDAGRSLAESCVRTKQKPDKQRPDPQKTPALPPSETIQAARQFARQTLELGNLLLAAGQPADARRAFETGVLLDQADADLQFSLGNACYLSGDLDAAARAFGQLVAAWPAHAEGHYNLGVVRMREGRLEEAAADFERALAIRPSYADARNNLAVVATCLNRDREAAEAALRLAAAKSRQAQYNLAVLRQSSGDLATARRLYRAILDDEPNHADAANNLGNLEMDSGRPDAALACFDRALRADAGHVQANWNRCLALLSLGRYAEAWPAYEWRFRQPEAAGRRAPAPCWDPAGPPAAVLRIHAEQGFGDTLQFARFLAPGANLPARSESQALQFAVPAPLFRLLERSFGHAALISSGDTAAPEADAHLPIMSLPGALRSEAVPDRIPYLMPDPDRVRAWIARLGGRERFRVGVVWSGNPRHRNDRRRSLAPELLKPLFAIPRTAYYSLQPGESAAVPGVQGVLGRDADFADTAALVTVLDLVISVDTSAAHLAGALGRPVWTLLPYAADWRWQQGRPDTPWYPTMRLFRQPEEGDWPGAIRVVRDALECAVQAAFRPDAAESRAC
jgi:tetratricopeptide (TPR) repeat protein